MLSDRGTHRLVSAATARRGLGGAVAHQLRNIRARQLLPVGNCFEDLADALERVKHAAAIGVFEAAGSIRAECCRLSGVRIGPPNDSFLLRSQQNRIYEWLEQNRLGPADFDWVEERSGYRKGATLTHRGSGFWVNISCFENENDGRSWRTWNVHGSPGCDDTSERFGDTLDRFEEIGSSFDAWAVCFHREAYAPDLWADLRADQSLRRIVSDAQEATQSGADQRFSADELARLDAVLDEVPAYLDQVHGIDKSQRAAVSSRLSYIRGAARRLLRVDWTNIVVGQIVAMAVDGVLPPNAVRGVLDLLGRGLRFAIDRVAAHLESGPGE